MSKQWGPPPRQDLKWHGYKPTPAVGTLEKFLEVIDKDKYGCFWG
jgi:hypothetical protein